MYGKINRFQRDSFFEDSILEDEVRESDSDSSSYKVVSSNDWTKYQNNNYSREIEYKYVILAPISR